jgi:hypothetical protein
MEYKRQKRLIYNRVGVTGVCKTSINNNNINLINSIFCIINGIFHGIYCV